MGVRRENRAPRELISRTRDEIIGGGLKPGGRLPLGRDLAMQFGASRTVIRDAAKALLGRGAGIFVATGEESAMGRLDALSAAFPLEGPGDLFDTREVLEARRPAPTRVAMLDHLTSVGSAIKFAARKGGGPRAAG